MLKARGWNFQQAMKSQRLHKGITVPNKIPQNYRLLHSASTGSLLRPELVGTVS